MVEVGKIGGETLVLNGRYISIFRAGKLVWKRAYRGYILPDGNLYLYRRRVRITELSGNTLKYYQIRIEIGAGDPIWKHARSAGEDIRFCYYPEENMIPHWIEKFDPDAEEAIIWVKVPSIPANSEIEIYMYYGNPTVASGSDASATFIRVIDGLVGAWHFDEGSGTTAKDTSGNGNDFTLYNGVSWIDGKFGKALQFDGSDDWAETPDSPVLEFQAGESFSMVMWVRLLETPSDESIANKGYKTTTSKNPWYMMYVPDETPGQPEWRLRDSAGSTYMATATTRIDTGEDWYFLAGVTDYSTGKISIWVNGVKEDEDTFNTDSGYGINDEGLSLGIHYGRYLNFKIDELLLIKKALTQEEISDLYNNYGYTTTNYPGKVLVRKYTEPEPSVSVGAEE